MSVTKNDWFGAGLSILERGGVIALTIDEMSDAIGLTKGSFYHHFQNMADFEQQLVSYWADQYLSTADDVPDDPADRLMLLDMIMGEGFARITGPEMAIRGWAQHDHRVLARVASVDAARRQFVFQVMRPFTDNDGEASLMADVLFALAIGSITALPRLPAERFLALYAEFKRLYGLP